MKLWDVSWIDIGKGLEERNMEERLNVQCFHLTKFHYFKLTVDLQYQRNDPPRGGDMTTQSGPGIW